MTISSFLSSSRYTNHTPLYAYFIVLELHRSDIPHSHHYADDSQTFQLQAHSRRK